MVNAIKYILIIILAFAVGYVGSSLFYPLFYPQRAALSVLSEIAYDYRAEVVFETKLEVLDSGLAAAQVELRERERENAKLERGLQRISEAYLESKAEFERSLVVTEVSIGEGVSKVNKAISGNNIAEQAFSSLMDDYYAEINLLRERLDQGDEYISKLVEVNTGLREKNLILQQVNNLLTEENDLFRDRVDFLSKPKLRHGPGASVGINPLNNYGFAVLIGWTFSWS